MPILDYTLSGTEVTALQLVSRGVPWRSFNLDYRKSIGPFCRKVVYAMIYIRRDRAHHSSPLVSEVAIEFIQRNGRAKQS